MRYQATIPEDEQLKKLLQLATGTDIEIPIMLYGGLSDKSTLTKIYQQTQPDHEDQESARVTSFLGKKLSDLVPEN